MFSPSALRKTILSFPFFLFPVACCLLPVTLSGQLPDTDIWLFDLKDSAGVLSVSNGVNITNRPGYDNQPSFSPDGSYILYTSIRDKQADIYKYDLKKKTITQLCNTEESEYSPMVTPDKKFISVVRVEKDSAQRIWKFPVKGKPEFSCVMEKIDSVGYYSWHSKDSIAIFVLTQPFSLQLVHVKKQEPKVIALNVGRCFRWSEEGTLHYFQKNVHGKGMDAIVSYYDHYYDSHHYSSSGAKIMMETIEGSEDYAFYSLLHKAYVYHYFMAKDKELFHSTEWAGKIDPWKKVSLPETYPIGKITRIVLSPDHKKIAIVSNK